MSQQDGMISRKREVGRTDIEALRQRIVGLRKKAEKPTEKFREVIMLCLDTSGSMSEDNKWGELGLAVQRFIAVSDVASSRIGAVLFSDEALIMPATLAYDDIIAWVFRYHPSGSTNMSKGIDVAIHSPTEPNRIILMSDGHPDSREKVITAALQAASMGIPIDTIAFGNDADEDLLREVALTTGGVFQSSSGSSGNLSKAFMRLETRSRRMIKEGQP